MTHRILANRAVVIASDVPTIEVAREIVWALAHLFSVLEILEVDAGEARLIETWPHASTPPPGTRSERIRDLRAWARDPRGHPEKYF